MNNINFLELFQKKVRKSEREIKKRKQQKDSSDYSNIKELIYSAPLSTKKKKVK